jgi:uncharacterized protein
MLMLISPAKTLDESPMKRAVAATQPRFIADAEMLVRLLQRHSPAQLASLMHISDKLASLNAARYSEFSLPLSEANAKPALFSFKGDVYKPIHVTDYSDATLAFANARLRILSGLYGVLRPLDYLYPYRLEMGTRLKNPAGEMLYDFWREKVSRAIAEDVSVLGGAERVVLNLASSEYSAVVNPDALNARFITVEFKQRKDDVLRTIGIHAKHARGLMVDYILRNHITAADSIQGFNCEGYRYAPDMSDHERFVFTKKL